MVDYYKSLQPWQRKKEYYSIIALGRSVEDQTELIRKASQKMIEEQTRFSNEILISQERISEIIDSKVGYELSQIKDGIMGMKASFDFGISEVVWQIEQNRRLLQDILEILAAPLDTQAKELKCRADEAYSNGWHEDALLDYLESEKFNRYDFSIHISLGMIYLFFKNDTRKAYEYFEKGLKYSLPKSKYHASYCSLYLALINNSQGDKKKAEQLSEEAIEIFPTMAEAYYQNALYNAALENKSKCLERVSKAIVMDVNYCEKILGEDGFKKYHADILEIFKVLRLKEEIESRENISRLKHKFEILNKKYSEILLIKSKEGGDSLNKEDLKSLILTNIERMEKLSSRNSYRDYLEINNVIAPSLDKENEVFKVSLCGLLSSKIEYYDSKRRRKESDRISSADEKRYTVPGFVLIIGSIISLLIGLVTCGDKIDNNVDFFKAVGQSINNIFYGAVVTGIVYLVVITRISQQKITLDTVEKEFEEIVKKLKDIKI